MILCVAVGLVSYFTGNATFAEGYRKPISTIFVNLLKFIGVPGVPLSTIDGILSMDDMKKAGAVGWKTAVYFFATTDPKPLELTQITSVLLWDRAV